MYGKLLQDASKKRAPARSTIAIAKKYTAEAYNTKTGKGTRIVGNFGESLSPIWIGSGGTYFLQNSKNVNFTCCKKCVPHLKALIDKVSRKGC